MADDWENVVIETGVDTLLNYLAENGEAPVSQISEELGVSEKRIKEWANALQENSFVEKSYSARKGMILRYTKSNKEEVDQRLEEVKEKVDEETEKIQKEMSSKNDEISEAKKKLKEMTEDLEENREEEEEIKEKLEELEELEEEIEEKLEKEEKRRERVHSSSVRLLSRIDNALNRIDEAEEKAENFEQKEHELRKKTKALKKLEKHSEKVEEMEGELEELREKESETSGIYSSFKSKLGSLFGGSSTNYEEILEGSVDEVKDRISGRNDLDYGKLLETERQGQDRKTLERFLERKKE